MGGGRRGGVKANDGNIHYIVLVLMCDAHSPDMHCGINPARSTRHSRYTVNRPHPPTFKSQLDIPPQHSSLHLRSPTNDGFDGTWDEGVDYVKIPVGSEYLTAGDAAGLARNKPWQNPV